MLAVTGLPLKFHHTDWGSWLYSMVGGINYAPLIHRISAVNHDSHFSLIMWGMRFTVAWKNYLKPLKDKGELTLIKGILALLELPMVPNLTDLKGTVLYPKIVFFLITDKPPSLRKLTA